MIFFFGQDTDEYKYVGSELKHLVDQMKTLMSERKQKQAEKASHHRRSRSNQNGYNRYDDLVFSEIRAERRCLSFKSFKDRKIQIYIQSMRSCEICC